MLTVALQNMRSRPYGFVGTFVALIAAIAIVTACGILIESGSRAGAPVEWYAGAPVVVTGQQSLATDVDGGQQTVPLPEPAQVPMALANRVAAVEGVRQVVADRSIAVTVTAAGGRILLAPDGEAVRGHGWVSAALTPYILSEGSPPRAVGDVVLDASLAAQAGVAVGDDVRITSVGGTSTYTVVGLAGPLPVGKRRGTVFVSDAQAVSLSLDPTRVDALGVLLDESDPDEVATQIERTLGGAVAVYTGDDRGQVEARTVTQQNQELVELGGAFGGIAAMLAIFVVVATLGLSVLQRGREIALLRAIGAKPRQIRRLLVGEAVVVALAAGVVGVAVGSLIASVLFEALQSRGIGADTASLAVGPVPASIAVGIGIVCAALAAWLAGRRAARIRPTAALAEAALEPKRVGWVRILVGVGFLVGGVILSAAALSLQARRRQRSRSAW